MPSQASKGPDEFFHALRASWITIPPSIQESFLNQTEVYMQLEARLRKDANLAQYDLHLYPELVSLLKMDSTEKNTVHDDPRSVMHFCNQQIQLMENVFYAGCLAEYHAHPINRGWMNLFRRWTATDELRLLWLGLRGSYSKPFVEFAEYHLNLPRNISLKYWKDSSLMKNKLSPDWLKCTKRLRRELVQEWPKIYEDYYQHFLCRPLLAATVCLPGDSEALGVGIVAKKNAEFHLMIWVRGAYRRLGLGRVLIDEIVENKKDDLHKKLNGGHELIVVLPPLAKNKLGYQEEMAGWLRFYGWKGFVLERDDTEVETGRLRLTRLVEK